MTELKRHKKDKSATTLALIMLTLGKSGKEKGGEEK
jgi:hypothetical protein